MKIGIVMLGVHDLARSVAFYGDVLGLQVRLSAGEITFMDAGAISLGLRHVADLGAPHDDRRVELVFPVDDIQSAYEALRAKGVTFRVAPRVVTGDRWAADFRDPDGHVLSIFGPNLVVGGG